MREGNSIKLITVIVISLLASLVVSTSIWTLDIGDIVISYYDIYVAFMVASIAVILEGIIYKNILYIISGISLTIIMICLYYNSVYISLDQYLQKLYSDNKTHYKISKKIGSEYDTIMQQNKNNISTHHEEMKLKKDEMKLQIIKAHIKYTNKTNEIIKKIIDDKELSSNDINYIESLQ